MWLSNSERSQIVNLDYCSVVRIVMVDGEKGEYELCAVAENDPDSYILLTSVCSLDHAKKQLSNIFCSISRGANLCRVYDEDETEPQNNDDKLIKYLPKRSKPHEKQ